MSKKETPEYSRALVPKHTKLYRFIIATLVIIILVLLMIFLVVKPGIDNSSASGDQVEQEILTKLNYDDYSSEREIGKTQMKIDYIDNCSYSISYPEIGIEEIDEKVYGHVKQLKTEFLEAYHDPDDTEYNYFEHVDYKSFLEDGSNMRLIIVDIVSQDDVKMLSDVEYTYVYDLYSGSEVSSDKLVKSISNKADLGYEFKSLSSEIVEDFDLVYSGDIIKFAITTVNVRSNRDLDSEVLKVLAEGDPIEVRSGDEEWEEVVWEGKQAFVKAGYLSRKKFLHKDVELEVVERGIDPNKPMVAITFDDGPNPKSTPRILDTLEKYGAVATFFDLGQLVNSYPSIVKREEAIGCEVGNHSYSHKNLNISTDEEIAAEMQKSEEAFIKVLGHKTTLFRPPYGNANLKVKENVDYPIIKWNVDSLDWKSRNKNKILTQIRKTKNFDGHIILLHSIYETTADATEVLVPELINQGYQLVTVSELAFYKGYTKLQTAIDYNKF